jgi:hypothetical protein
VVSKVRERKAVSKQAAQKFDGERFKLRKLKEQEVMFLPRPNFSECYQVLICVIK